MKKRIIIALTAIFVLGLVAAVYAINQTDVANKTMADCCKKSESCPMKSKTGSTAAATEKAGCCDMDNCCCNNGSCPMNGSASASADGACCDMDSCCCKGGACPMKKKADKETAGIDLKNVTVAADGENCCTTGADCCKGGACCKGKQS